MQEATRHILSFGGGVNSAALMIVLLREGMPFDETVFADTGGEVPETYDFLPIAKEYLESRGVKFVTLTPRKRGLDLYENSWARRVFPSAIWRWSTRDFKVLPLYRYYRSLGVPITQYLGIAYDEFERMKDSRVEYVKNLFPLVDRRMTRQDCIALIKAEGLPVPVKSGCYFCPFNSIDRWRWLYETHPELYDKAVALEENSKHFPAQRLTDQVFRTRNTVTLRELPAHFGEPVSLLQIAEPCGGECMT